MSSLDLINNMLSYLGANNTNDGSNTVDSSQQSTLENETESKHCDTDTKQDMTTTDISLTLRGIPEYNSYPYSLSGDRFLFMADMIAPLFQKSVERAAIDLVCVIDESGSMSGDRIELVKQTIAFIIKNLESNDRFGIIGFANDARQILPLTRMDTDGQRVAQTECDKIKAQGGTSLCNGLIDGIKMLKTRENNSSKNNIASVMLFTDGKANRGITNQMKILNEMDKYMLDKENDKNGNADTIQGTEKDTIQGTADDDTKQENEGEKNPNIVSTENEGETEIFHCSINTFGFGKDHNDTLLQEIAERGNGMYSFIETVDGISETFAEALGGLISVCGQNLYVTIKAVNGVAINKCLSKRFKKKMLVPGKEMQIIIPDIQSEEKRSLVFELRIPSLEESKECTQRRDWPIIEFSVQYNNTIVEKKEFLQTICSIHRVEGKRMDAIGLRNMELDIQNNRIVAADAMEKANNCAENGKLSEARKVIKSAQILIGNSRSKNDTFCATLVADLESCLTKLVSQYEYRSSGRQYMMMNSMSHYNQRSTQSYNCNNVSQARYRTSHRSSMRTNFSSK